MFVRSRDELPRARAAASKADVEATQLTGRIEGATGKISIGTMHFAKGLEFRAVAVMACEEQVIPAAQRVSPRVIAEIMGWDEESVEKIIRRYVGRNAVVHAVIAQLNQGGKRT